MVSRKSLADDIDALDAQIKDLNESKRDAYNDFREQLEGEGMDGRRASAELAATKAAIARRRKLLQDPEAVHERDDLIDDILTEIMPSLARAREGADEDEIYEPTGEHEDTDSASDPNAADQAGGDDTPSPASPATQSLAVETASLAVSDSPATSPAGAEGDEDRQPSSQAPAETQVAPSAPDRLAGEYAGHSIADTADAEAPKLNPSADGAGEGEPRAALPEPQPSGPDGKWLFTDPPDPRCKFPDGPDGCGGLSRNFLCENCRAHRSPTSQIAEFAA